MASLVASGLRLLLLPLLVELLLGSVFLVVESVVSGPHITDLNVLLPPRMTHPVEYRLQGSGGCFSWSWDHHDILSVHPEYNSSSQCSTSARLISISPYNGRKETSVYATDLQSGTVIRCEVFIDMISRIKIFHHSVKLDLDGLATLRVHAFDEEDNVFSSLVGLKFVWQLLPKSPETDGLHNLIHVPLKETPLSDCHGFCGELETRIKLEDSGLGSDLYVVKGVEIGQELISASLREPQLEHVEDKIVLTVAEPMFIDPPSPVFVTIGAVVNYQLWVIRLNNLRVIDFPSKYHRWSVVNSSVAQVDREMAIASALNLGNTNVVVEDTRLSGHVQTSSLHVVIPDKMSLYLLPITNVSNLAGKIELTSSIVWYVFPGQEYIIHVKVVSQGPDAEELFITEENDLKMESDSDEYWNIRSIIKYDVPRPLRLWNSRLLKPTSEGQGFLTSSITYHSGSLEIPEVLKVEQEIVVCNKVKFVSGDQDVYTQIIRLPWVPGIYQEVELKASGGCAKSKTDYRWFSSDPETISVSASGSVQAKLPGKAVIKVVSSFDAMNYDEVVVEASIPYSMVILPYFPVEAAIGKSLQAAVTLKTSDGNYYYRCDAFASVVKWNIISGVDSFKVVNTAGVSWNSDMLPHIEGYNTLYGPPCAWTLLYASHAGRALLQATLSSMLPSYFHSFDGPFMLKATSSFSAYSPFMVHQAGDGNEFGGYWVDLTKSHTSFIDSNYSGMDRLYLVPGSGMDILLLGGPEPWDESVEYIDSVEIHGDQDHSMSDGLLLEQISSSSGRLYRVVCLALGSFNLLFTRGNLVSDDHPLPTLANLQLAVVCSLPSSITLLANEPVNTPEVIMAANKADRGPGRVRGPVVVANGCTIRVAAVGIHVTNRAFANSSSLRLNWELSGCEGLAHLDETISLPSPGAGWERFLVLNNMSGKCIVRATVVGFSEVIADHLLEEAEMLLKSTEDVLTDAVRLQLVSSLRLVPEFILLVFDPEAKVNLYVTGGTCFLDAETNNTQVIQIIQPTEDSMCSYLTVGARGLGVALVTVVDKGLSPPSSASASVKVANVEWIKIISEEEISLVEGAVETFNILSGTHDGDIFDSSQYVYMNIHVHIEDGILDVVNGSLSSSIGSWIIYRSNFSVRALDVGTTTLYVSARQQSGFEIFSQRIKLEVYRPLKMHPGYIYLTPGASYTLTLEGGPKSRGFVKYDSKNIDTAIVQSSSGKVSAISVGNSIVHASIFGNGGTFICEAYGQVEVGIPSAFSLNLQSDQLCVGCGMPIFPTFREGNLFSFYEICKDYKWTIEDEKVLSFQRTRQLHADMSDAPFPNSEVEVNPSFSNGNSLGFIKEIFGRSAGRTRISVSFSCEFVLSGTPHRVSYNASEFLRVVPDPPLALGIPVTWILPPFYTALDLLPASSDSSGVVDSPNYGGNFVYSVLKACGQTDLSGQDALVIDGNDITTKESNTLACIQAKDKATGRTEIASCVRVAEVAQVRLSTAKSSLNVLYLPLQAKVKLVIRYTDSLGYTFYEAHEVVPLDIETNYPDILSILMPNAEDDAENVVLQAKNPGSALVRISMKHNPKAVDYILVSVGAQVFPQNPVLRVGHHLNFSIIGDGASGPVSGCWSSANRSILHIDRKSGEAHALGEGVVEVIFEAPNYNLQTTVTVLKMGQIVVEAPAETLTNVPYPSKGYRFPVRLSDLPGKLEAAKNPVEAPYTCRINPLFVGFAKPWIDHATGSSYCHFFPYSPKKLQSSISKSDDSSSEGFLYISITASLKENPHIAGSAHALFVGGFSILEVGKLNLTPSSNRSLITIMGNTDVEIYWNAKDHLLVRPLKRDGFGIGGHVQYEVKVLIDQQFSDKLTVLLPATGQTADIDISYESSRRPTSSGTRLTWAAVFLCVIILLITIVIFIKLLDRPSISSSARLTRPTRQGGVIPSPATPNQTSPDSIRASPRTPQPLAEYARQTLDQTPYYKRDGRRRFDPQYTY
ncbi:nuclear pore complex protein GP210 isoform X1 [Dioscorea cayenensis subsp. rotundata]|uniref:Nuclear pore complex protein GP210 isoform X1 n=2 Tax=Dioscorea cayennensis subsp. rotundata TaxID=55577 RepID=A0AB40CIQ1_DIOCR|nr:nuclear pore complex protein GP210 isoform X1 [Dioscorea cayenensis subsp. rotundata]